MITNAFTTGHHPLIKTVTVLLVCVAVTLCGYYITRPLGVDIATNNALLHYVWIPTAAMALMVGALLANSGLLVQAGLDNGFASPTTLGVSSGALLGATVVSVFVPSAAFGTVWVAALIGGITLASIVVVASQRLNGGKLAIILIGMALGLSAGAVASTLILFFENETDGLFIWGSGKVLQTNIDYLLNTAPFAVVLCLLSLVFLPKLHVVSLGDNHAKSLGVNVRIWRFGVLLLAIIQASLVIALVGMLGFVGLVAPHIARYLMAKKIAQHIYSYWLATMLVGGLMVFVAEWASRSLSFIGYRLPTGAMCALVGAPFIIWLLLKNKSQLVASMQSDTLSLTPLLKRSPVVITGVVAVIFVCLTCYLLDFGERGQWINNRVLMAALAGLCLGVAGAILQSVFKNPMASPDTLGVSTSGIMAIAILLVLHPSASIIQINIACMTGALLVIGVLAWGIKNQYSIAHIALLGLALSAFASTVVQILLTFGTHTTTTTMMWLTGTSYLAQTGHIIYLGIVLLVSVIALVPLLRALDILPLGDATPQLLGVHVKKTYVLVLVICALLTTASVASIGAIGFVGLMAPHFARLLGLYKHKFLVPASACIGAILLVLSDALARNILAPNEIPCGLFVSVLGGVYFLGLILFGYKKST